MRNHVRQLLRKLGLERIRTPTIVDLMTHEGVRTVLDVGANEGQYAKELRILGYKGRIVSFEPMSEAFGRLKHRADRDPSWDAHNIGLGTNNGFADLNLSPDSVFNSFKPLSDYARNKFKGAQQVSTERAEMRRLDDILTADPSLADHSYLKIDAQGFEKEVMLGAGDRLTDFRAVQVELPIQAIYEDQPLIIEMATWMDAHGFAIAMAKENGVDWQSVRLLELDVVFVPKSRN